MANSILLVSCLGAGLAGGLVGGILIAGGGGQGAAATVPSDASPAGPDYEERFQAIENQVQGLLAGQSVLSDQLSARSRETVREFGAPTASEPETATGEVFAALDADPQFDALVEARVQSVIEAREREEREEREAREAQQREQWTRARVDRLAQELSLSEFQKGEMTRILLAEGEQRNRTFQEMRESGSFDRETVAASMREINAKTEVELSTLLTPDQLSRYKEMNVGGRDFGGPGFGGGRGQRGNG